MWHPYPCLKSETTEEGLKDERHPFQCHKCDTDNGFEVEGTNGCVVK